MDCLLNDRDLALVGLELDGLHVSVICILAGFVQPGCTIEMLCVLVYHLARAQTRKAIRCLCTLGAQT
jgi:hypothetical protein